MSRIISIAALAALAAGASTASAVTIPVGGYVLGNHPDGSASTPAYGFRLDELYDETSGHDIFTFDFEAPNSEMFMTYNGTELRIFGKAEGGRDTGSGYAADAYAGLYEIDFTYDMGVQLAGGDDDVIVDTADMANTGTIKTPLGDTISLWDKRAGGFSFRLGDEGDNSGHRGWGGISGWGWVNHTTQTNHVTASDWLFTAQPGIVPAPASLALVGMGGLVAGRRRRA